MLKIKDNVDLKELEKFGFEEDKFYYKYNTAFGFCWIWKDNYDLSPREIELQRIETSEDLEIIFDLCQAGLVEKVV